MVAICKSMYVVYRTNCTHKFLHSGLFKYFCMGKNGWRVSYIFYSYLETYYSFTVETGCNRTGYLYKNKNVIIMPILTIYTDLK